MTDKSKTVPDLRFAGYTDAWEQRKVGELIKDHNAGIYISKDKYGEGTNVIGVSNIYDSDIFNGEIYRLGPVDDDKFLLEEGDIVYGESSLVLEGIARTICVGKNGAGSAFAWHTRRVKLDKMIVNPHFATLELNYHSVVRKHLMSVATQTALTGMTTEGYFSAPLFLPSVKEQDRISEFFINLDNLITLHQRKYDGLQLLKKSMLQKMFPKEGETKPEVRFAGFTDAWEQRKLSEISDVRDGTHDSPSYLSAGHPFVTSKNVKEGYINYDDIQYISDEDFEAINKRSKVDVNDILMGMIGTIGNLALIRTEPDFAIKNVALIKDTKQVSYMYLYHYLQSPSTEQQLLSGLDGGTQKFVSLKNIRELNIMVPSETEQIKVGAFMESLDNLITLHQRKLEQLKTIKQFLLQKMFV